MPPLSLKDVTVCAVDCLNPSLAVRALERCSQGIEFGRVVLFSDADVSGDVERVPIETIGSFGDYSKFILRKLVQHIKTDYVLVVQWDGFVVAPELWTPEFLTYDYIGAVWPLDHPWRVGNGGFSLRSYRLLERVSQSLDLGALNEDAAICQILRPSLEAQAGIRFAPEELAARFSHERVAPTGPTFGFHGMFNLYRYLDDSAMVTIAQELSERSILNPDYLETAVLCLRQQRPIPMVAFYSRWRAKMSVPEVEEMLARWCNNPNQARTFCSFAERFLSAARA